MIRFAARQRRRQHRFPRDPEPVRPSGADDEQLGQPLSGGCVRQAPEDAIWMWNWAPVGTVVVVLA